MSETDFEQRQKAVATREFRLKAGRDPDAVRWQEALELMLIRIGDRLVPGRLESFQNLSEDEAKVLKAVARRTLVPDGVCAIYIPPSALETMMSDGRLESSATTGDAVAAAGKDIGVFLGVRCGDYDTILYAQFGLPPNAPGVEIYTEGEVVAVYQYPTLDACITELNGHIETFLAPVEGV